MGYCINIGEQSPTSLTASQNGIGIVQVSWTAQRNGRFVVRADPNNISMDNSSSPQNVTIQQPGVYEIRVLKLSRHLPGTVGPVMVTVKGEKGLSVDWILIIIPL